MQIDLDPAEIELAQWLTELEIKWWDGNTANIQTLDIGRRRLIKLPESIDRLINLQTIDLRFNQITSLPESIGQLTNLQKLVCVGNRLTNLPKSIGQLINLQHLYLSSNQISSLPESIGQLTNLQTLICMANRLTSLPKSIGQLTNLQYLYLGGNQISSLPESIGQLTNLQEIDLRSNALTDLSPLKALTQKNLKVYFLGVDLPHRYWMKLSDWQPEWLLDEDNAEIRRALIQQVSYEKICDRLGADTIDSWREYILLKMDDFEAEYDIYGESLDEEEPMILLKMTCPSTGHIHILRVPPEMESAEAAITWINHGIHPNEIAVQT